MGGERVKEPFMPWKKSEPMEQRVEFALQALRSGNFRELCQEYGISSKTPHALKGRTPSCEFQIISMMS